MSFPNVIQDISDLENKHITDTSSTTSQINTLKSRMSSVENGKVNTTDLINLIYPVGSIYMSVNNVSPSTFLGGTWERIQDRFLLGAGSSYSAGSTGGEASHKLTIGELPGRVVRMIKNSTTKILKGYSAMSCPNLGNKDVAVNGWAHVCAYDGKSYGFTIDVACDTPHNNMPPYLAVYIWKRTL